MAAVAVWTGHVEFALLSFLPLFGAVDTTTYLADAKIIYGAIQN